MSNSSEKPVEEAGLSSGRPVYEDERKKVFHFRKKRSKKTGLPPGTPVYVGEKKDEKVKISVLDYDEAQCKEKELKNVEECFLYKDTSTVTWINIDGIHDVDIIGSIGKHFGFHPLILEDIVNTEQRPKIEDFGDYLYIVLKMLYQNENADEVMIEQVSLVLGKNFVISFQEREGDIFDHVRERIREGKGRIRKMKADYLAYALLDAVVDSYFFILEKTGEQIEDLEEKVISHPKPETLQEIHKLKRGMIFLRKSV